jgi:DNA-binding GntR family transcriptional regulator
VDIMMKWENIAMHVRKMAKPNAKLPSESDLMARFNVSRATVRRAMHQLVSEGRVRVIPGKGWYGVPEDARCPTCGQDIRPVVKTKK